MERLKREILESQCFDNVKKEHPDFLSFVETKIEPIEGDIVRANNS